MTPSKIEPKPSRVGVSFYRFAIQLCRPFLRFPFPGRWKIFALLLNNPSVALLWHGAGLRWTRSKTNEHFIPCDLSVFSGRIAWIFRRWYEIDTESVLQTILPKGGTFVDIGANVGMASLSARRAIGATGRIVAFEPQPAISEIFRMAMQKNQLKNVELVEAAISSHAGTAAFFSPDENHGEAHFDAQIDKRPGSRLTIKVVDGSVLEMLDRIDAVKLDVEGHELTVLRAIDKILTVHRPLIVCEVMGEHLRRAGTRPQQIIDYISDRGYSTFSIGTENVGLFRQRARIDALRTAADDISCNALLIPLERAREFLSTSFVSLAK